MNEKIRNFVKETLKKEQINFREYYILTQLKLSGEQIMQMLDKIDLRGANIDGVIDCNTTEEEIIKLIKREKLKQKEIDITDKLYPIEHSKDKIIDPWIFQKLISTN
jgi:hypothetical protein